MKTTSATKNSDIQKHLSVRNLSYKDRDPVIVTNLDGRLEVFAIGEEFALWHRWLKSPGAEWDQSEWTDWTSLGGKIDVLAVGKNADGRLEVFGRGTDYSVWHIWQLEPNGNWGDWKSLGGEVADIAVDTNQDGRIEVFAIGTNTKLYHIWQSEPNGNWSGWSSLEGEIDRLVVGKNADGRLDVFGRGLNGTLYYIVQKNPNGGEWSEWLSMGEVINSVSVETIAVARTADGRLHCFTVGDDLTVKHIWQPEPNSSWSNWEPLGGKIIRLFAGRNINGTLEVFGKKEDGSAWHVIHTDSGWSDWTSLNFQLDRFGVGNDDDGNLVVISGSGMWPFKGWSIRDKNLDNVWLNWTPDPDQV